MAVKRRSWQDWRKGLIFVAEKSTELYWSPKLSAAFDHDIGKKYSCLLKQLPPYPKHDLQTWEFYQLDADGIGTTKLAKMMRTGENVFTKRYFGVEQARKGYRPVVSYVRPEDSSDGSIDAESMDLE